MLKENESIQAFLEYRKIRHIVYEKEIAKPLVYSIQFQQSQFSFLPQDSYITVKGEFKDGILRYCDLRATETMPIDVALAIFNEQDITQDQLDELSELSKRLNAAKVLKQPTQKPTLNSGRITDLIMVCFPEITIFYIVGNNVKKDDKTFKTPEEAIAFVEKYAFENGPDIVKQIKLKKAKNNFLEDFVNIIANLGNNAKLSDITNQFNKSRTKPVSETAVKNLLLYCKTEIIYNEDGSFSIPNYESYKKTDPLSLSIKEDNQFEKDYLFVTGCHPALAKEKPVFLGVDFGTSYTKIAYQFDPKNKGIIKYGDSYFKSTVVYYDGKKNLSMFNQKGFKQIRFFKCTMVKDQTHYSELRYKDLNAPENFEFLCSVFFLANMIKYAKCRVDKDFYCNTTDSAYVAMGIPLSKNDASIEVYNKALHAALYINRQKKLKDISNLTLKDIQKFYEKSLNDIPFSNGLYDVASEEYSGVDCTIPELFTEALYVLKDRRCDSGYYYVVDIGGGTTDFAFIRKEKSFQNNECTEFFYYCPSAVVTHLGNEVRKACSNSKKETEYQDRFAASYYSTVGVAKQVLPIKDKFSVKQLFFGGGSTGTDNPYLSKASKSGVYQQHAHQILCSLENPEDLTKALEENPFLSQEDKEKLSLRDRQRLIIACQLASEETRFSYLSSFPSDYKSVTNRTQDAGALSFFDKIRKLLGYEPSWF